VARIQPVTAEKAPPEVAAVLQGAAQRFGEPLVSTGIAAHCPPILSAARELAAAPARSGLLPAELRALVCLRVAQLAGCPF
jgi:alkylhydroperoxidase family enzyme